MIQGINLYGNDLFGNPIEPPSRGQVTDEFIVPPFTVLNSREGFWQKRKRMWLSFGINGEIGRSSTAGKKMPHKIMTDWAAEKKIAGKIVKKEVNDNGGGVSVFDPVLCEISYKWFCPHAGQIIDPFSGGSVRGIVASLLGFKYWGSDLNNKQVTENINQAKTICHNHVEKPVWVSGDSSVTLNHAPEADFIFSCPPYGDLERYSDDSKDLSNMEYDKFLIAYKHIIKKACLKLKQDRFACFIVGDFRDKSGFYRRFIGDTVDSFKSQGLEFYNEAILITPIGSGAMLVGKYFRSSRKFLKVHQNMLVFVKGDPIKATQKVMERL